jgi:hypothetical protein
MRTKLRAWDFKVGILEERERQTDRQTDRQAGRQTESRCTEIQAGRQKVTGRDPFLWFRPSVKYFLFVFPLLFDFKKYFPLFALVFYFNILITCQGMGKGWCGASDSLHLKDPGPGEKRQLQRS